MKKFSLAFLLILGCASLAVFESCQSSKNSTASKMLKFNLESGKGYDYETTFNIDQEIMGQKISMDMTTYYSMVVEGEEAGVKTIGSTIDRFKMNTSMAGINLDIDTDKPYHTSDSDTSAINKTLEMMNKVFSAIKGRQYRMKVNQEGKILEVTGFETMFQDMMDSLDLPEKEMASVREQFEKQFNADEIRQSLERYWFIFPNKEVKVGDTWEKNSEMKGSMPGKYSSTYKVKEIEGDMVTLEEKTKMEMEQDKMKMDGDITGTLVVDSRLGLIVSGSQDMKLKASTQGMSFDIIGKTKIKGVAR
jgi:hypothetical protein